MEGEPRFEMKFIRRARDRRQEPGGHDPAADGRGQVSAARRDQPGRGRRRIPEDARRAVRLSRDHPRQRRGGVVLARSAADARRLRQQARRRPADARRPPIVCRRRLGGHAGRRSAAGRTAGKRARQERRRVLLERQRPPDARRPHLSGHAARRYRKGVGGEVGHDAGSQHGQPDSCGEAGRHDPADRHDQGSGRNRSSSPTSATAAASRSRFPIQDSWIWKMDATMAVEDTTHATFWRRLVRWLVDGVPDPVALYDGSRSRRAGRTDEAHRGSRRPGVRRSERRAGGRAGHVAVRQDH